MRIHYITENGEVYTTPDTYDAVEIDEYKNDKVVLLCYKGEEETIMEVPKKYWMTNY